MRISVLFLGIILLSACSTVNQPYRDEVKREQNIRHGIIPLEKPSTPIKNPLETTNALAASRGKALYEKNCLECHGSKGLGDGPMALNQLYKPSNLQKTVAAVPYFKFFMSFSQKQGAMPGWKSGLSDAERDDIVEYIKTFN